jgi:hypothetical protein
MRKGKGDVHFRVIGDGGGRAEGDPEERENSEESRESAM